jgi:GGDEF domain-containing protein
MAMGPVGFTIVGATTGDSLGTSLAPVNGKGGRRSVLQSAFLAQAVADSHDNSFLLCDPLTGLVAYPSFEQYMTRELPELAQLGLHVSIGDVDDLRNYVTSKRFSDPQMFGHLAGNLCMKTIGETVQRWRREHMLGWPMIICGTFGGDEVIIGACGLGYSIFTEQIAELANQIRDAAPRPCSFASATLAIGTINGSSAEAYRHFISTVDRALFDHKTKCKGLGNASLGNTIDIGCVELVSSLKEESKRESV